MPDAEIEQMAGDGLEPSGRFVATLREELRSEWRGDASVVMPTPRRRAWGVVAGLVAAAAGVVGIGLLTTRGGDRDSIVGVDTTVAPTSTAPPNESPTAGLPGSAMEQLWVVTSVDGSPVEGPDMPTFTPHADGTITGWDGCNHYEVTAEGGSGTVAGCPDGVTPIIAGGPFMVDSLHEVRTSRFAATSFERRSDEPAPAYRLDNTYRFGDQGSFDLQADGTMTIDHGGCEIVIGGTWRSTAEFLTLDVRMGFECAGLDPVFQTWFQSINGIDTLYTVRDGDAAGLWMRTVDRVTRLEIVPSLDGVPAAAIDVTWVVTDVAGVPYLPTHDIPTFAIDGRGQLHGFDGCTRYTLESEAPRNCSGIQQVRIDDGPFELLADGRLRAGEVIGAPFDAPTSPSGSSIVANWKFDERDSILLQGDGTFLGGHPDCLVNGTYLFDGRDLQLELASPLACSGGSDFERWIGDVAAQAGAVRAQLHSVGGTPELWVITMSDAVTRLSRS